MGIFNEAGERIDKDAFPAQDADDPEKRLTADVYASRPYGRGDGTPGGSIRTLIHRAGHVVRQSQIDALSDVVKVDAITPASGPAAGGTEVTITGRGLDGATSVKFGANAGTALRVDAADQIRVKTPAGTAGKVNVVLADDSGDVTRPDGFTYT